MPQLQHSCKAVAPVVTVQESQLSSSTNLTPIGKPFHNVASLTPLYWDLMIGSFSFSLSHTLSQTHTHTHTLSLYLSLSRCYPEYGCFPSYFLSAPYFDIIDGTRLPYTSLRSALLCVFSRVDEHLQIPLWWDSSKRSKYFLFHRIMQSHPVPSHLI